MNCFYFITAFLGNEFYCASQIRLLRVFARNLALLAEQYPKYNSNLFLLLHIKMLSSGIHFAECPQTLTLIFAGKNYVLFILFLIFLSRFIFPVIFLGIFLGIFLVIFLVIFLLLWYLSFLLSLYYCIYLSFYYCSYFIIITYFYFYLFLSSFF